MPSEIEKYKELLQLSEGEDLSQVNQIYFSLLVKIEKEKKKKTKNRTPFTKDYKNEIEKIKNGESLDEKDFEDAAIGEMVKEANLEYQMYCAELKLSFQKVLQHYINYNKSESASLRGIGRRLWHGYAYNGTHYEKHQNFVHLIDMLALMDSSGDLLNNFQDFLGSSSDAFSYEHQSRFLNMFYNAFQLRQKLFFEQRKADDEARIKHLQNSYGIDDKDLPRLRAYYFSIVHPTSSTQETIDLKPPECKTLTHKWQKGPQLQQRFIFDVHQVRNQCQQELKDFKKELKALKKNIHHLAQGLGLLSRIKKRDNNKKQGDSKKQPDESVALLSASTTSLPPISTPQSPMSPPSETTETSLLLDSSTSTISSGTSSILTTSSSAENIEAETEEEFYQVESNPDLCKSTISPTQKKNRKIKKQNAFIAKYGAKATSIGEGCVAASQITLAIVIGSPLVIMFAIMFSAYYINQLLFRGDSRSVLDAVRLRKKVLNPETGEYEERSLLFIDQDNHVLSKWTRRFVWGCAILNTFIGVAYGTLSFMSSLGVLPQFFSQIATLLSFSSAQLPFVLTVIGSAIPAVGMAIGIASIFFYVISDFFRENRWAQIKEYFNINFLLRHGNGKSAWSSMSETEKDVHIAKCVGRVFLLTLAIALTVVVTVASAGVFYKNTLNFLHFMSTCDPMHYFAKLVVWVNGVVSCPMQVKTTNGILQPKAGFTFSNVSRVSAVNQVAVSPKGKTDSKDTETVNMSPDPQVTELVEKPRTLKQNRMQKEAEWSRAISKTAVYTTSALNGVGMGYLNRLESPNSVIDSGSTVLAGTYSFFPNASAGLAHADSSRVTGAHLSKESGHNEEKNPAPTTRRWRAPLPSAA